MLFFPDLHAGFPQLNTMLSDRKVVEYTKMAISVNQKNIYFPIELSYCFISYEEFGGSKINHFGITKTTLVYFQNPKKFF